MSTDSAAARSCPVPHGAPSPAAASCPFDGQAAAFDPYTDAYMASPAELLRWSREEQPVFYSPRLGYWVVTRYESIKSIFRDPLTFSP